MIYMSGLHLSSICKCQAGTVRTKVRSLSILYPIEWVANEAPRRSRSSPLSIQDTWILSE